MKKILLALALCLVMVGLIALPAFAATQKADLLKFTGPYNPPAKAGYATFTTNQGDNGLVVGITLTSATAKTKYDVYLREYLPEDQQVDYYLGYLTTNSKGKWGGQNEQYQFVKVLSAGQHTVGLVLMPWTNGAPPNPYCSRCNIWTDEVTVNITKN